MKARRLLLLPMVLLLGTPALARAQLPTYAAAPPTPGSPQADGQTGCHLLGGEWLYRADPSDSGLARRWWAGSSTLGWAPVTVPNAYNAGDFSSPSMTGSVGWYRRDFTLPAGAFARTVPSSQQHWIVRFESVNYRASVWLNGRLLGSHTDAYVPFEFDLKGLRPGVNRLVVRVDDRRTPADLPPGPGGGWWNFGGLLRAVYLRAVSGVDISQADIVPHGPSPGCPATIEAHAPARNPPLRPQDVTLRGQY